MAWPPVLKLITLSYNSVIEAGVKLRHCGQAQRLVDQIDTKCSLWLCSSIEILPLKKERKKEKMPLIFTTHWFGVCIVWLGCDHSRCKYPVEHDLMVRGLELCYSWDVSFFVMYCIYGAFVSSLLIESTDSMIGYVTRWRSLRNLYIEGQRPLGV